MDGTKLHNFIDYFVTNDLVKTGEFININSTYTYNELKDIRPVVLIDMEKFKIKANLIPYVTLTDFDKKYIQISIWLMEIIKYFDLGSRKNNDLFFFGYPDNGEYRGIFHNYNEFILPYFKYVYRLTPNDTKNSFHITYLKSVTL